MPLLRYSSGELRLDHYTAVMGILNVTPDSFSDGGKYFDPERAVVRALEIQEEGADILDIGAQSTRPGHMPVSPAEEWARMEPVLRALRGRLAIPVSIDTYYAEVAGRALEQGAAIINDVSGSMDNGMPELAAQTGAALVMMHAGAGADDDHAADAAAEVRAYFERALELAAKSGMRPEQVCLDPGIGFGKSRGGDVQLIARLPELLAGLPDIAVLVGASRKRVVGMYSGSPPFEQRLAGTLALHTAAQLGGARILRVHDVKEAVQAARVTDAVLMAGNGGTYNG